MEHFKLSGLYMDVEASFSDQSPRLQARLPSYDSCFLSVLKRVTNFGGAY